MGRARAHTRGGAHTVLPPRVANPHPRRQGGGGIFAKPHILNPEPHTQAGVQEAEVRAKQVEALNKVQEERGRQEEQDRVLPTSRHPPAPLGSLVFL